MMTSLEEEAPSWSYMTLAILVMIVIFLIYVYEETNKDNIMCDRWIYADILIIGVFYMAVQYVTE